MAADNDKLLLEGMIGTTVSRTAGVQVPIDTNLPVKFPQSSIHYELYKNHIELHIEPQTSNYVSLCHFLERNLPDNDQSRKVSRSFCRFAYVLNREIKGWRDIEELGHAIIELRDIVEPVMISYCNVCAENMEIAKVLADFYENQKENLPFHINVIDELHANENAHTRILTRLLKYKTDGKYAMLASFLSLIPDFCESEDDINASNVSFNQDFIDCLIECQNKFAIIIENKIHNAQDQGKQIERYVLTELSRGIPEEKIWTIYLTSDGRKKVSDESLTPKAKSILQDRFLTMDYRHNILPWLKDSILPNCKLREDWLITALKQYIDHLEGIFGLRSSQSELRKNMDRKVLSSLGISRDMSNSEKYSRIREFTHHIESLQNILETSSNNLVKPVIEKLKDCTAEVFSEICPDQEIDFYDGLSSNFFQVFIQEWSRNVHFEWIPLNNRKLMCGTNYTFVVHIEDKKIEAETISLLEDNEKIAEDGQKIGFYKVEGRTYYKKSLTTTRSIAEMTHNELCLFLKDMYADVPKLIDFIESNNINKLSDNQ